MENLIDLIIKFVLVSSAFLLILGGVSFLVVHVFKIRGRAKLWICSIVILIPFVYPMRSLLPDHAKVLVSPEKFQTFYSQAIKTKPGNIAVPDNNAAGGTTEEALIGQPIGKQVQASNLEMSNYETSKPINKKSFADSIDWKPALAATWIALFLLILVRFRFIVKKTRLLLQCADCVNDPYVLELLKKCVSETGLQRIPRLLVVDYLQTPMVVGFLNPAVILPLRLLEPKFREGLRFTLLHELKHLYHHHSWWLLIEALVSAAYFFHPVIYWAKRKIHEEWEYICDNHVIKVTNKSASYADFLLHEIWNHSREMNPSLAVLFIRSATKATKRVYAILEKRTPTLFTKIRDRIAVGFISLSFISLLLCSVAPSAHVRAGETSRNRIAPIDKPGEYDVSTSIRSSEELKISLQDQTPVSSQQEPFQKLNDEKMDGAAENPGSYNSEPVNVSHVSGSTPAVKEDKGNFALREIEKDDAVRMTSSNSNGNSPDAANTDPDVAVEDKAGIDTVNHQSIVRDLPKKENETDLFQPLMTASLDLDKEKAQIRLGNDDSIGAEIDATPVKGDDNNPKPAFSKAEYIPEKYNLDSQLEKVSKFWRRSPVSWESIDNQSFILENGFSYYLIVLNTPDYELPFRESLHISNGMIRPGFDSVNGYVIYRIYRIRDYEQVKAIRIQLGGDKEKTES